MTLPARFIPEPASEWAAENPWRVVLGVRGFRGSGFGGSGGLGFRGLGSTALALRA